MKAGDRVQLGEGLEATWPPATLYAAKLLIGGEGYELDPASTSRLVIYHLDGVDWADAPTPRRWHRCWQQTRAFEREEPAIICRCPCGAIRYGMGPWINRNSTRKGRHRQ